MYRRSLYGPPLGSSFCEAAPITNGVPAPELPAGGALRCSRSTRIIDARAGQEFVLHGEGFLDSERFQLDDRIGSVTIRASPASRGLKTFSLAVMAVGSAATLGCGIGLPIAGQAGSWVTPAVGICLGGGLVALGASLPLFFVPRTTYTISGLGSFHF